MKKGYSILVGALTLSLSSALAYSAGIATQETYVPGEVIVHLKEPANGAIHTASTQNALLSSLRSMLGKSSILSVKPFATDASFSVVKFSSNTLAEKAVAALQGHPEVESADLNYYIYAFENTPNDPGFEKQWSLNNFGQPDAAGQAGKPSSDIDVLPVWQNVTTGNKQVIVAVIDTGVDLSHPDLVNNLYVNPGEAGDKANNGIDDDHNGFVDDYQGWNFTANNNKPQDGHDHGTHCSGIIGAVGNNKVGISGVNQNVSILPIKVLTDDGRGDLRAALEGINYAAKMNARIMSNSWGGPMPAIGMRAAIRKAGEKGILFVAAAGNDSKNNDSSNTFPANFDVPNMLSVAATDNNDVLAKFSNFGATKVHVAAPGVKIISTVKGGEYKAYSGTSMATPHVAGIAALMIAANPALKYAELKDRLIKTSDPVDGLKSKSVSNGRVNAYRAVLNR